MTDLFWPGDHRAGALMSDGAFLEALLQVENAWLATLVDVGVAPDAARFDLTALVGADDLEAIAVGAERDGNPVTRLVALLRDRARDDHPAAARWLHRGLTSQDVMDTALVLCLRSALDAVTEQIAAQVHWLTGLVEKYRDTPMLTRTLTQPALQGTAGVKFAVWLTGVLDAADTLKALPQLPVQIGGAAGTLAAATELTGSPEAALRMSDAMADRLGLASAPPWHTTRSVLTRTGDALVTCTDAWGHIANDMATATRAGELTEGSGGGSSTMPHKSNPVLSVLLKRAALIAPQLGATLHAASAAQVDERADGGWHAEWATARTLARRTVVAASQATDLLAGLHVDEGRTEANLASAQGITAEQHAMSELVDRPAAGNYLGASTHLIDAALLRARHHLKETR